VDHANLPTLSEAAQRAEIYDSKAGIEQQLGHPINHFCYPYGSYNQASIDLAIAAGFTTATTTVPGDYQAPASLFTLRRIRETWNLP
jgi:peptidoglycan/xylan/chitin deacetylase (PgdA/CDA1 family)